MKIIDWRICAQCTDACEYCFASEILPIVSRDAERVILEKIARSDFDAVNITGGEPMLDTERCLRIIDTLCQAGKKVYLSTNGFHVAARLQELQGKLSLLGLPLDGFDEASNRLCGRSAGAFARVIGILADPAAADFNIKIGSVVTKANLSRNNLLWLSRLLDNYPVKTWRIYEMLPENRGLQNRERLLLSPEEQEALERYVRQLAKAPHPYRIELVTRQMRDANYMIIRPDGSVMVPLDRGDAVSEVILGSLLTQSLDELKQKWQQTVGTLHNVDYFNQRLSDVGNRRSEEQI